MEHRHVADGPPDCFGCKVKTIQFGIVPGGYRSTSSLSNYDPDTLPDFPNKEEVMDARHDYRNAPVKEVKVEDL